MLILVMLGLVAANFIWQTITVRDWEKAFERSWFQVFAALITWIMIK